MSYNLRIIQEYFQPKIGRRIRIFSLGRKNNILIKKKSVVNYQFKTREPKNERRWWSKQFKPLSPIRMDWKGAFLYNL